MPTKIMLACNDWRNGNWLGVCESVEIADITLVGGRVTSAHSSERLINAKAYEGDTTLRVGRVSIPCLSYKTWVGNWCWDCASVRAIHALKVMNYLAGKPDWHCEEAEFEIFKAFNDRRVVTVDEWKRYLGPPSNPANATRPAEPTAQETNPLGLRLCCGSPSLSSTCPYCRQELKLRAANGTHAVEPNAPEAK